MGGFSAAGLGQTITDRIAQNLRTVGTGERVRELQRYWATYWGTVYDLDGLHDCPLAEWDEDTRADGSMIHIAARKPAMRYGYGAVLVDRVRSLLGAPTLRVEVDGEHHPELSEALGDVLSRSGWGALWEGAVLGALVQGSAVASVSSRGVGRLRRKVYLAHECFPVFGADDPETADRFDIDDDDLVGLQIAYVHARDVDLGRGAERRWYLFRRDLTPLETITYEEVDVTGQSLTSTMPEKVEAAGGRVRHGLGFVPAVWVRPVEVPGEVDGASLLTGIEDVLSGIDRQASQRYRACETHGDPKASPKNTEDASILSGLDPHEGLAVGARRILPIPLELLEISASGQTAQAELVRDLQRAAQERTGVYVHNPERSGGALSGVAQEQLYLPTVALVRRLRGPVGDAQAALARKTYLLAQRMVPGAAPLPWPPGAAVVVDWPPVIPPTVADVKDAVMAVAQARAAQVVSRRTAVGYAAHLFGVTDADAELAAIDEEVAAGAADLYAAVAPAPGTAPGEAGRV